MKETGTFACAFYSMDMVACGTGDTVLWSLMSDCVRFFFFFEGKCRANHVVVRLISRKAVGRGNVGRVLCDVLKLWNIRTQRTQILFNMAHSTWGL